MIAEAPKFQTDAYTPVMRDFTPERQREDFSHRVSANLETVRNIFDNDTRSKLFPPSIFNIETNREIPEPDPETVEQALKLEERLRLLGAAPVEPLTLPDYQMGADVDHLHKIIRRFSVAPNFKERPTLRIKPSNLLFEMEYKGEIPPEVSRLESGLYLFESNPKPKHKNGWCQFEEYSDDGYMSDLIQGLYRSGSLQTPGIASSGSRGHLWPSQIEDVVIPEHIRRIGKEFGDIVQVRKPRFIESVFAENILRPKSRIKDLLSGSGGKYGRRSLYHETDSQEWYEKVGENSWLRGGRISYDMDFAYPYSPQTQRVYDGVGRVMVHRVEDPGGYINDQSATGFSLVYAFPSAKKS